MPMEMSAEKEEVDFESIPCLCNGAECMTRMVLTFGSR